jgi:hypothetical protein
LTRHICHQMDMRAPPATPPPAPMTMLTPRRRPGFAACRLGHAGEP